MIFLIRIFIQKIFRSSQYQNNESQNIYFTFNDKNRVRVSHYSTNQV
jgi:hypothetical protein